MPAGVGLGASSLTLGCILRGDVDILPVVVPPPHYMQCQKHPHGSVWYSPQAAAPRISSVNAPLARSKRVILPPPHYMQ